MTLFVFGAPRTYSIFTVLFFFTVGTLLLTGAAALTHAGLSMGEERGRSRTIVGVLLLTLFTFCVFSPLFLEHWTWPRVVGSDSALRHCLLAGLLGAAAFAAAGSGLGLGGRILSGALIGGASGLAGLYADRALFLADALTHIGYPASGIFLLFFIPLLFAAVTALWIGLAFGDHGLGYFKRFAIAFGVLFAGVMTCELSEDHMRSVWDFGSKSLTVAARIPSASEARTMGVVILADKEGRPGRQYREYLLAAAGVDASRESLDRLGAYLEEAGYQTVHLGQGLKALRQGEALNWEMERYLDAAMVQLDPGFPPDTLGFLGAIRFARASKENFDRLEKMGSYAWFDKIPKVITAQKTFEGFSTAYARHGERNNSDLWLDRIRGLWPLYEDNIHIEPVEENRNGRISGSLKYNGGAAQTFQIGLFTIPSTMTVINATSHLTASIFPDGAGRFEFTDLLPGRYYLAIQADPILLDDPNLVFLNSPGEIRLTALEMSTHLFPIQIQFGKWKPDDA